jgi:hypothetical protein
MTDHLKKAKHDLYHSERADLEYGYLYAAQSIAHALIAIAERLGTPKSRIDPHDWSQAMQPTSAKGAARGNGALQGTR